MCDNPQCHVQVYLLYWFCASIQMWIVQVISTLCLNIQYSLKLHAEIHLGLWNVLMIPVVVNTDDINMEKQFSVHSSLFI